MTQPPDTATGETAPLADGLQSTARAAPRIHLYALCWNEAQMLPFFFRHYDAIVDRYYIFDNGSTDGSLDVLQHHPKVTLGRFAVTGASFVRAAQEFYNECWKPSRGLADWVIVCNVDEHLYHPDLPRYLAACQRRGISLVVPKGYEMVSDAFPTGPDRLCEQVRTGVRLSGVKKMDKPELFAPDRIEEINFSPGRHRAYPRGRVRRPLFRRVKLLHYKYLGLDYMSTRLSQLRQGLRAEDIRRQWGRHYLWDVRRREDEFDKIRRAAVPVV